MYVKTIVTAAAAGHGYNHYDFKPHQRSKFCSHIFSHDTHAHNTLVFFFSRIPPPAPLASRYCSNPKSLSLICLDTQRLVNNHVIRLYEIYQSPEQIYLVVERAPCGTLEEFLFARGRMTELDAKRVVRQLLDGLAYLHKSGVVHCDLKPANILFTDIDQGVESAGGGGDRVTQPVTPRAQVQPPASLRGLVVKICDFGHARKVPDCRYYKFTRDINKIPFHMFKHTGTEGFVAPEVLRSEPYGKAADMWSTGCMINQMLTGRMPWIPSRACLQRPLSTSGHCWKNISEPAKSLVEDLLTADQALRADVEQATHHSWFEGIHHCARMPTSAPGGKASPMMAPVSRERVASVPTVHLSPGSPKPPRGEGVLSGDVAAGGGSSNSRVKEKVCLLYLLRQPWFLQFEFLA